jgi:hypothetical protein
MVSKRLFTKIYFGGNGNHTFFCFWRNSAMRKLGNWIFGGNGHALFRDPKTKNKIKIA